MSIILRAVLLVYNSTDHFSTKWIQWLKLFITTILTSEYLPPDLHDVSTSMSDDKLTDLKDI